MSEPRFHSRSILRVKPEGGYRRVSNAQICMAWRAYKSRLLPKFYDFRVYLALHEVAESLAMNRRLQDQRIGGKPGPRLTYDRLNREVHAVMRSLNHRLIRASIGRLEQVGLVSLTGDAISFASHPTELHVGDLPGFGEMWNSIDPRERVRARTVPIPRRILRYLAQSGTPGITATFLGHAIRCLWFDGNQCSFAGHCSTRFVADLFDVDIRTVKRARATLASKQLRCLISLPISHWARRHGALVAINPEWSSETTAEAAASGSSESRSTVPPRQHSIRTDLPPPYKNRELKRSGSNQYRKTGAYGGAKHDQRAGTPPRLTKLVLEDLENPARRHEVLRLSQDAGWIGRSDFERLRLFAAAEHALRVGETNPCGLFVAVVRRNLWHHISNETEDIARRKLRAFDTLATAWPQTDPLPVPPRPHPTQRRSRTGCATARRPDRSPLAELVGRVADQLSIPGTTRSGGRDESFISQHHIAA